MRWHSTDFGNFVADAVKVASGADLVLVNAGSFRLDGFIPARITTSDLRNVFLYDRDESTVIVLALPREHVLSLIEHARTKGGHGAFLQISDSQQSLSRMDDVIRVAIIRHILSDPEDAYQKVLAGCKGIPESKLKSSIESDILSRSSLIRLIQLGAAKAHYSNERRLEAEGSQSSYQTVFRELMKMIDAYIVVCLSAGIDRPRSLDLLEPHASSAQFEAFPQVLKARANLVALVRRLKLHELKDVHFMAMYEHMIRSREVFESGIRYQDYLDCAGRY